MMSFPKMGPASLKCNDLTKYPLTFLCILSKADCQNYQLRGGKCHSESHIQGRSATQRKRGHKTLIPFPAVTRRTLGTNPAPPERKLQTNITDTVDCGTAVGALMMFLIVCDDGEAKISYDLIGFYQNLFTCNKKNQIALDTVQPD